MDAAFTPGTCSRPDTSGYNLYPAGYMYQVQTRHYSMFFCGDSVADLTCADSPCQNGGTCRDTSKSCSRDTDGACGITFTCECRRPFAGRLCHLYRRCFADVRLCFQTDYQQHDYRNATEHCLRQGDLTKPVILNRFAAFNLRVFVEDDPLEELIHSSVWLAAEARQLTAENTYWRWLDGLVTSRRPISPRSLYITCFYNICLLCLC